FLALSREEDRLKIRQDGAAVLVARNAPDEHARLGACVREVGSLRAPGPISSVPWKPFLAIFGRSWVQNGLLGASAPANVFGPRFLATKSCKSALRLASSACLARRSSSSACC